MSPGKLQAGVTNLSKSDRKNLLKLHKGKLETFAFKDWELGNILFDVTQLRSLVAKDKIPYVVYGITLIEDYIGHIKKLGGVDVNYAQIIPDDNLAVPCISAVFETGESVLIDGNNRIIGRWEKGLRNATLILIPWPAWRPYSYWENFGELPPELEMFKELPNKEDLK